MKWHKKGLIYCPTGELWWAKSHALIPTVYQLNQKVIRVYFASLDKNMFGRVGYVELDSDNPQRILNIAREPILDLGQLGTFDDCGVVPSCIVELHNQKYMYYTSFQRAERVPYMLFTGLARGNSEGTLFKRCFRTPVLDRTNEEPFSRSCPYIIIEGGQLKMWYLSGLEWTKSERGIHYNIVIKYAVSQDGINWNTSDHVCITPNFIDEYAVGRPCVIREDNGYKMWYSIRSFSKLYSIGYAESEDGIYWLRKDEEVGIQKSENGWDSEMICYPYVIDIKGKRYMFYNGNGRGASGFGYAVLES